jgi:hypothetical protein
MKDRDWISVLVVILVAFGVLYIINHPNITGKVFSGFFLAGDKPIEKTFKISWDSQKDDPNKNGIFDGTNHVVLAEDFSFGNSFNIDADVRLDGGSSGLIVSQVDYPLGTRIELSATKDGRFRFFMGNSEDSVVLQTDESYFDGNSHSVSVDVDSGLIELSVDHSVEQSVQTFLVMPDSSAAITIGANSGYVPWMQKTHNNFKGVIKKVKVKAPKNEV